MHECPITRFGHLKRRNRSPASGWRCAHAGDPNFQYYLAAAPASAGLTLLEMTGKLRDAEKAFGESAGLLATLRKNYTAVSFYPPKHAEALSGAAARSPRWIHWGSRGRLSSLQALLEPVVQKSPRDTSAACLLVCILLACANIAWKRNDRDAAKSSGMTPSPGASSLLNSLVAILAPRSSSSGKRSRYPCCAVW